MYLVIQLYIKEKKFHFFELCDFLAPNHCTCWSFRCVGVFINVCPIRGIKGISGSTGKGWVFRMGDPRGVCGMTCSHVDSSPPRRRLCLSRIDGGRGCAQGWLPSPFGVSRRPISGWCQPEIHTASRAGVLGVVSLSPASRRRAVRSHLHALALDHCNKHQPPAHDFSPIHLQTISKYCSFLHASAHVHLWSGG